MRVLDRVLGCAILILPLGCAAGGPPLQAPPATPPSEERNTRAPAADEEREREGPLQAPPPAYGNKVVLAKATCVGHKF